MTRDFDSSAYQKIASEIAERIERGELRDGDRLPTRPELEERYGVSRQVVQSALNLLHDDGYLRSFSSQGTFVRRLPRVTLPINALEQDERPVDAFVAIVEDAGHTGRQTIRVENLYPEPAIVDQLRLGPGDQALVRRRIRYVDEIPYAIADSYFPYSLVRDSRLADPRDITEGGRHILTNLGYRMARHHDSIIARRPRREEMTQLGIAPGAAVIGHNRLSSTEDGRPIRLLATVLPADRWEITYEGIGA